MIALLIQHTRLCCIILVRFYSVSVFRKQTVRSIMSFEFLQNCFYMLYLISPFSILLNANDQTNNIECILFPLPVLWHGHYILYRLFHDMTHRMFRDMSWFLYTLSYNPYNYVALIYLIICYVLCLGPCILNHMFRVMLSYVPRYALVHIYLIICSVLCYPMVRAIIWHIYT